jgi:hypothetical protein
LVIELILVGFELIYAFILLLLEYFNFAVELFGLINSEFLGDYCLPLEFLELGVGFSEFLVLGI